MVWLCHDDRLDDDVAIKVLADNHAERLDVRDRFIQEARVLRRTTSQHVVQVYDVDELPDGRPYFVMTHADGGSLADALQDGWLPVDEALRVGADVARGVQDLHDAGVVHRDVKPSNVLFRTTGVERRVLVADLGLSRELARGSRITLTAGTPGFMSPEQATNAGVDHRADVYGIGATVYCALTGREPPANEPPPRPSTLRPGLSREIDGVVLRALARDPEDRWPTARALGGALQALRAAVPAPAPRRRHRLALGVAAGVLAVAATVTTTVWLGDSSPTRTATHAQATTTRLPCAVLNGVDHFECFLHARGDTSLLLDFYSYNSEVVLWELKPDNDTFAYSQRWQFLRVDGANAFLVYNAHTDRCLTMDGKGEVGAGLHVTPCDPGNPSQLWEWTNGTSQVLRSKRGTCLDIPRGEYEMKTLPFAYDCNGGTNQQWLARAA